MKFEKEKENAKREKLTAGNDKHSPRKKTRKRGNIESQKVKKVDKRTERKRIGNERKRESKGTRGTLREKKEKKEGKKVKKEKWRERERRLLLHI